jgi:hypothetical protein
MCCLKAPLCGPLSGPSLGRRAERHIGMHPDGHVLTRFMIRIGYTRFENDRWRLGNLQVPVAAKRCWYCDRSNSLSQIAFPGS